MCGLFGMVRQTHASNIASKALMRLGRLAVERGHDSAGMAFINAEGGLIIDKGIGEFQKVFKGFDHAMMGDARTIIGHTRWASQGNLVDAANMSPMTVGRLIATHNGDVEIASIPGLNTLPHPNGGTDTERLFQAIASEASIEGIAKMLSQVKGRAALAWIDTKVEDTLYLARAALSPMATALDAEGNLYWASNPDWFRQVDKALKGKVGFHTITMFNEGTLAIINTKLVEVEHIERFTPIIRAKDSRLISIAVHRGFTLADKTADLAGFCHTISPEIKISSSGITGLWDAWTPNPRFDADAKSDQVWGDTVESEWDRDESYDWWNNSDDAFRTATSHDLDDEASEFVIGWADEGCPTVLYDALMGAATVRAEQDFCHKYRISDIAALALIRPMMAEWMGYNDDENIA